MAQFAEDNPLTEGVSLAELAKAIAQLCDELGSEAVLAERLEISTSNVSKYRRIPWGSWSEAMRQRSHCRCRPVAGTAAPRRCSCGRSSSSAAPRRRHQPDCEGPGAPECQGALRVRASPGLIWRRLLRTHAEQAIGGSGAARASDCLAFARLRRVQAQPAAEPAGPSGAHY